MAKKHYKFNPERLDFETISPNIWRSIKKWSGYVIGSILLSVVYYIIYSQFFHTREERSLIRENELLQSQITTLDNKFGQLDHVMGDILKRDSNIYRSLFEADPIRPTLELTGHSSEFYRKIESYSDPKLVETTGEDIQLLDGRVMVQNEIINNVIYTAKEKRDMLMAIPSILPIKDSTLSSVGASVGMRIHPFYKVPKMHTGIDFTVPEGTNVYATADGTVATSSAEKGQGNTLIINHGYNYKTYYTQLNEIDVRPGQKVKRGDIIAKTGMSGMSNVPHLHYEVRKGDKVMDPLNYFFLELSHNDYQRIILLASNNGQSLD